ncbi:MAG: AbrB/MazE/SpoVT family DNA-binding domain-containing protein [Nanoarchaeota archaeon]|nr:AbrB/MazE/SpoVT family DNA-binding domain-containing protein [Nanoarchaeota archaeon]
MAQTKIIVKKWGNSLGIVLPHEFVEEAKIKPNKEIEVILVKSENVAKRTFGMAKSKLVKDTQRLKNEIRRELHKMK